MLFFQRVRCQGGRRHQLLAFAPSRKTEGTPNTSQPAKACFWLHQHCGQKLATPPHSFAFTKQITPSLAQLGCFPRLQARVFAAVALSECAHSEAREARSSFVTAGCASVLGEQLHTRGHDHVASVILECPTLCLQSTHEFLKTCIAS